MKNYKLWINYISEDVEFYSSLHLRLFKVAFRLLGPSDAFVLSSAATVHYLQTDSQHKFLRRSRSNGPNNTVNSHRERPIPVYNCFPLLTHLGSLTPWNLRSTPSRRWCRTGLFHAPAFLIPLIIDRRLGEHYVKLDVLRPTKRTLSCLRRESNSPAS